MRRSALPLLILSLAVFGHNLADSGSRSESLLRQRLVDARAIEEVRWSHRIWPASNGRVKPPLSSILPDAILRDRVEETLRKSQALQRVWNRPITPSQLQAEIDRMAEQTRDSGTLRELFAALGNDPRRVAESLARPALVDRLIRDWYAMDGRLHAATRRRAEEDSARIRTVEDLRDSGGEYHEIVYVERRDADAPGDKPGVVALEREAWERLLADLMVELAPSSPAGGGDEARRSLDALPARRVGPLQEDGEGFSVHAVLEKGPGRIRLATAAWRKRSFDEWWNGIRATIPPTIPAASVTYTLAVPVAGCVNDTWRPMRTDFPYGRQYHSAIWTGNEMIIYGGLAPIGALRTGYRYQPATDTWTPIRADDTAPIGRHLHAAVWTGTEMVVWGGDGLSGWLNTGGRYNPLTDTWRPTRLDATTPAPRVSFAAVWTGTEMFVWGGGTEACNCYVGTGGLYDPVADTWRPTSNGAGMPEGRANLTAVWTGSEVIVWGGFKRSACCANLHQSLDTGSRYSPSTDSWTPIVGGGARAGHTAVWTGSAMLVWGGTFYQISGFPVPTEARVSLKTGSRYDPVNNSWTPILADATAPAARSGHTAVWTGSRMIVWGGGANTGGQYDPASDRWTPTRADATTPAARFGSTAVWTGSEMIVWGGMSPVVGPSFYVNTGGRYDPASDTWVPTHAEAILPTGAPQPPAVWTGTEMLFGGPPIGRYDPATDHWSTMAPPGPGISANGLLVWTGTEMISWRTSVSGGGRYNPTSDTWGPVSVTNSPPNDGATAVWSGHEMIVWGGAVPGQIVNTGGRYDPATNTWRPTRADATTPAPRTYHTAVWTGSEMIVWGGRNDDAGGIIYNTGGRYDPVTDAWMATSAQSGKPDPRWWHSAVWSGTEMIVWGGHHDLNVTPPVNTGWGYSPSSDTWRAIAVDAATPSGRHHHAAVWSGGEMIVWGGTPNQGTGLSTGGRYDPVADAWMATRDDGTTPSSRRWLDFASAWTGTELLIWGGRSGFAPLNDGAGYCACFGAGTPWYRDADGDGFGDAGGMILSCAPPAGYILDGSDCDDANGDAWAIPGEAKGLVFTTIADLAWSPPSAPGAALLTYDVIRSGAPGDFVSQATCVASDTQVTAAADSETPPVSEVFYYLVRAVDACPSGEGDLGTRSDGTPRTARSCP